jgi:hypothetical protein
MSEYYSIDVVAPTVEGDLFVIDAIIKEQGVEDKRVMPLISDQEKAQAALEFCKQCLFHQHVGIFDCGDKFILWSNRGLLLETAKALCEERDYRFAYAADDDGCCMALVVFNYDDKVSGDDLARCVRPAALQLV